MINEEKNDIMKAFKPFELEARKFNKLKDPSQHALFFIFYSGHGCMSQNKTAAIDINQEIFEIENDIVEEVSCRANTTTIAFLDCCRV